MNTSWSAVGSYIGYNATDQGLKIQGTDNSSGASGELLFKNSTVTTTGVQEMVWGSIIEARQALRTRQFGTGSLPNVNYTSGGGVAIIATDLAGVLTPSFSDSIAWRPIRQADTVTVGGLPAAATANRGLRFMVTDANATWTAGIGAVVAGGGANVVPVTSDGTNWRIG